MPKNDMPPETRRLSHGELEHLATRFVCLTPDEMLQQVSNFDYPELDGGEVNTPVENWQVIVRDCSISWRVNVFAELVRSSGFSDMPDEARLKAQHALAVALGLDMTDLAFDEHSGHDQGEDYYIEEGGIYE